MIQESIYLHYLNALLAGDKKDCRRIVISQIDQGINPKDIYLDLFQRSMYRIGQLWENERCSIADEHVATSITEGLIELVAANCSTDRKTDKFALITCIDKEYHELGPKIVAGFLETYGWDTLFIGANTPIPEILTLIESKNPDIVGISSSFYINVIRLMKLISAIKEVFPEQEILVGGQALSEGRSECLASYHNVKYVSCLNGLEKYLLEDPHTE